MGIVKLYIMYWGGVYGYYNSMGCPKSVAKHHKK